MNFVFCRLYPFSSPGYHDSIWVIAVISLLLTNTVSPGRAGFRSGQVGSGQVRSGQVGSGRVRSGKVGSGKVVSGKDGSGQVGSGDRCGYEKGICGQQMAARLCRMRKSFNFVTSFKTAAPIFMYIFCSVFLKHKVPARPLPPSVLPPSLLITQCAGR
jgi:hypothetical protein